MKPEEREDELRRLLWLNHGHEGLYGDDGEMQCNRCPLDFKRATVEEISRVFNANALKKLAQHEGSMQKMEQLAESRGKKVVRKKKNEPNEHVR